ELYLAAADLGPVLVDRVKRGPDRGHWRVDEVRSPVVFWERSQLDEDGALVRAGRHATDRTARCGARPVSPAVRGAGGLAEEDVPAERADGLAHRALGGAARPGGAGAPRGRPPRRGAPSVSLNRGPVSDDGRCGVGAPTPAPADPPASAAAAPRRRRAERGGRTEKR